MALRIAVLSALLAAAAALLLRPAAARQPAGMVVLWRIAATGSLLLCFLWYTGMDVAAWTSLQLGCRGRCLACMCAASGFGECIPILWCASI